MTPPLRVAYILHRFPYLTETFILREMRHLVREGVALTIFSLLSPKGGVVHEDAQELADRTRYAPVLSRAIVGDQLHFLFRTPLRYLRALAGVVHQTRPEPRVMLLMLALFPKCVHLARRMQRDGIEHVHVHFVWLEGIAASVITELTGIPFSITPHAFGLYSRPPLSVRRELLRAARIITVSEYNRRFIAELLPEIAAAEIDIVRYGVDTDQWRPAGGRVENDPPRLLSVGRAVEKKGHEDLIAACGLLSRRGVPFTCRLLAGSGPATARLRESVRAHGLEDRVEFLEPREQQEVLALYQQSDIFVLASKIASNGDRDGVPNVLIEAMACGLPVVSTTVSGIPELVDHERSGLLVPPSDPPALAAALERLIGDRDLRERLGGQGRARVLESYRTEENAAQLASIFRAVQARRRAARRGGRQKTLSEARR